MTDREKAEKIVADWYGYQTDSGLAAAILAYGEQVRREQREVDRKAVCAEVAEYKGLFALVHGVEGDVIDVTCEQIIERLGDLFTREQIELGE